LKDRSLVFAIAANRNIIRRGCDIRLPLAREDLNEFVECFHAENQHERTPTWSSANETSRWRSFTYEELVARDKVNLDIFWLRDESLEDSANLPAPNVLAAEITEELRAALEQFDSLAQSLGNGDEQEPAEPQQPSTT